MLHGQDMTLFYDSPHLLKCIKNNLSIKDLDVNWNKTDLQGQQFATWNVIEKGYQIHVHFDKFQN